MHLSCTLFHMAPVTNSSGKHFQRPQILLRTPSLITSMLNILEIFIEIHLRHAAAAAKSLQSCPTLCHPRDDSPPGSPVPGILQARTLEWVAISFSNAWKGRVKVKLLSHVRLLATSWTAAHQALHPWDFPGRSTGVGLHCLLQGIV